ncbi:MAG: TetR/AcrR family transcriptional regulator [Ignavibacteriales bacterium]|nr:TetR/AcrR family transcriptional regulator [Ignavibacteriales bacterium]
MRKKDGKKEIAIVEAAIQVIAKDGYHHAKVHKIAEIAGIAVGSIYSYYDDKLNILLSIFDNVWKKLYTDLAELNENPGLNPVEKLDRLFDLIFDVFETNQPLAMVFVQEQNALVRDHKDEFTPYFEKYIALGEAIVSEGKDTGVFRSDLNISAFRTFYLAGVSALLHLWLDKPEAMQLPEIRVQAKQYAKVGILNSK